MPSLQPQQKRLDDRLLWTLRLAAILFLTACPWYFGSVGWNEQSLFVAGGICLAFLLALSVILTWKTPSNEWRPVSLTWLLFGLGCFAMLQSQPRYDWVSAGTAPPSVQMQRWALGLESPPEVIRPGLISTKGSGIDSQEPCGLDAIDEKKHRFAISVEPVTTQAAAGNLFLAAILAWLASTAFRRRESYPVLLASMTLIGCLVAIYGLIGAATPRSLNWLGLKYGSSFSVFVSKNSAGAFLNTSIAAALGMVLSSAHRPKKTRKPSLRSEVEVPWKVQAWNWCQNWLSTLDLSQIIAILSLFVLMIALVLSLCRGAVVSGMVGLFSVLWLMLPGKRTNSLAIAVLISIALGLVVMIGLQVDEQALHRIESIGEIDIDTEVASGRLYIWGVSAAAAKYYGWLGSGLGTFHFASLPFQKPSFSGWFYHAESLFAEIWVTLGTFGLIAATVGLLLATRGILRIYVSERFRDYLPLQVAAAYMLISQTVHAAVDFALILPGVYIPAVLLLGAALGSAEDSRRVLALVRRNKELPLGLNKNLPKENGSSDAMRLTRIACLCLLGSASLAMLYSFQALRSLAIAYRVEKEIEKDDRLEIRKRMPSRIDFLVNRVAELGGRLDSSPDMQRLVGDCICYDVRMKQWQTRSPSMDDELAWNQTAPFAVRLVLDRITDAQREPVLEALGGENTIASFQRANDWYARGQSMSPLDWRLVWGRTTTAFQCPTKSFLPLVSVLQRTAANLPQTLISASILVSSEIDRDELMKIWQQAIQTSPTSAIDIGKVIAAMTSDDDIPIDFFPKVGPVLRDLASSTFTAKDFPKTHAKLCELALEASRELPWPTLKKSLWMAVVANEAGNYEEEIENLRISLQFKPNDTPLLLRLAERLLDVEDTNAANDVIRTLERAALQEPSVIPSINRLKGRLKALPQR
ncbi:MAG: O-antigen ligase family protein [Planctomycetota bacterium]